MHCKRGPDMLRAVTRAATLSCKRSRPVRHPRSCLAAAAAQCYHVTRVLRHSSVWCACAGTLDKAKAPFDKAVFMSLFGAACGAAVRRGCGCAQGVVRNCMGFSTKPKAGQHQAALCVQVHQKLRA